MLSYDFTRTEKDLMLAIPSVQKNDTLREMLRLSGKSVFTKQEAVLLAQYVKPHDKTLARRIKRHPGMKDT